VADRRGGGDGGGARVIGGWLRGRDDRAAAERRRQAELCARADRQHAAVLAGDEFVGVYGDYLPCDIAGDR
jgi:hypothetical protein